MMLNFKTIEVELIDGIATITLNRPDKLNAMNGDMWKELKAAMCWLDENNNVRVGILKANGSVFSAGVDLSLLFGLQALSTDSDSGRLHENMRHFLLELQDSINAVEHCSKPIIAAIHGGCIGGGMNLITACDMRYCTVDAYFALREVDMVLTTDVGTLQRLPRIIGEAMTRELVYTGRRVSGVEAQTLRLVNACFDTPEYMMRRVATLAASIATKSPRCIRGSKAMISYTRDHSSAENLNYAASWNSAMLASSDLEEASQAFMQNREAVYED
jgi:enoyl-CoA hydratase